MGQALSDTERKILDLRIKEGLSRKEIADKTYRSELTVKTHFQNIAKKTGCKDEIQLVVHYLKKYKNVVFIITILIATVLINSDLEQLLKFIETSLLRFTK